MATKPTPPKQKINQSIVKAATGSTIYKAGTAGTSKKVAKPSFKKGGSKKK